MKMFVIDEDMNLWEIMKNCPKIPRKKDASGNDIPKSECEFNQTDLEAVLMNYRA